MRLTEAEAEAACADLARALAAAQAVGRQIREAEARCLDARAAFIRRRYDPTEPATPEFRSACRAAGRIIPTMVPRSGAEEG